MRIISGKYGGFKLDTPHANSIHPMGERIRGAIFNSLLGKVAGAQILDACAGSGSLGLEAISRGAERAALLDKDRRAIRTLQENLAKFDLDDQDKVEILPLSMTAFVKQFPERKFDLIFVDPPYQDPQINQVSELAPLLKNDGILVLSISKRLNEPDLPGLESYKNATYAEAKIIFYQAK